ncbi:polyribonucleotide nucleotidyltransferase [Dissulfurirhabdus thermomarina]|uniref:Polyribonucleotide nucleotidyltransferase n=1 Tax=Dissulfurirhabdus thermomarina TaxID=1765737 RepID=A0A6N9TLI9_DISTH|nr:polyribonucleotide nucleotidyltransferase [Dissulfurirhabdus thermomarina]NDY41908.1 polyribonucleotide nucleotidyltransferase [Dissulfurirhabdus thermomarina]NMX23916.1 polyribonucleotide nucleotidyltransferase [Dissulfurirhabdus thermomarina]
MIKQETRINDIPFRLETGRVAKQANGSVLASYGDTVVLVTAVTSGQVREGIDFLPLLVEYKEMYYAAGRIPGSYFRREIGRPTEKETTTSRFIDRPLRPRFPAGYRFDTQIIATVLSVDPELDPDVVAITAASAALTVSDIPFDGPIAGIRVGRVDGRFVANPSASQLARSDMNIIVAGSRDAIVMVEGGAAVLPERDVQAAITFGHQALQPLLDMQDALREQAGRPKLSVPEPVVDEELAAKVRELAEAELRSLVQVADKMARGEAKQRLKADVLERLQEAYPDREREISGLFKDLEKEIMRDLIVREKRRIDGRSFTEVRPITCSVGELPRTHGSALFTRGETQAMVVATLGSAEDEQRIETLSGQAFKHFMLHYNFPPYCVGEVRPMRGPSRRDIGHGALAERALSAVVPPADEFQYTIRIVSEVLESNGSSSMATVCGGTLAMMDAGIPIRDMVAGVAMGLIKEGDDFIILTDILGDEDHLGDMDFKVAGTREGITALQMDIKVSGIDEAVLEKALAQAREARLHILDKMAAVIDKPRAQLSEYAPKITTIQINPDRIRDLIGPGGKTIRALTAECGVKIDVEDSGQVNIFAPNGEVARRAVERVKELTAEAEVGRVYTGTVKKIMDFGAFVEILPGTDGLVHISQLARERVNAVSDVLKEGDTVEVKVLEIDKQGRIRLSRKAVLEEKGKGRR